MRSLLPLTLYCISLVSLQQLLTLALEESPDKNRLDLLNKLFDQRGDEALESGSQFETDFLSPASRQPLKHLTGFRRHPKASRVKRALSSLTWARPTEASQIKQRALRSSRHVKRTLPSLAWAQPTEASHIKQMLLRVRRHAPAGLRGGHHYPHHAQLMRVGCVLGTCQVQNLSHRLYQLIGQSGREDSSPINPRSPHSYG